MTNDVLSGIKGSVLHHYTPITGGTLKGIPSNGR